MRISSAILCVAVLTPFTSAIVSMKIARNPVSSTETKRQLSRRTSYADNVFNNQTSFRYVAQGTIGTPPQTVSFTVDTGSSDTWAMSSTAPFCSSLGLQASLQDGCVNSYNSSQSSTYELIAPDQFSIIYGDGSSAYGDFIKETFTIGGATIDKLELGCANTVTGQNLGLLGLGYDLVEVSSTAHGIIYPNILDTMASQGLIQTKAFSLYLNDLRSSTGEIIFGGLDTNKYHGNLFQTPILQTAMPNGTLEYWKYAVAMTSLSVTGQTGNTTSLTDSAFSQPVVLDSGFTNTVIPSAIAASLYNLIGAINENNSTIFVDCAVRDNNPGMTFNFGFGGSSGLSIQVPASEVITNFPYAWRNPPFENLCSISITPLGDGNNAVLGDSFLRSAYVVYDQKNNLVGLGQTNFNSTTSNLVDIPADATGIPNASGVATATGVVETVSTSVSSVGSASPSSSKSGAIATVPGFDARGLILLCISGIFVVLGAIILPA